MKTINTVEAVGTVLCHDLTRIIKDEVKETVFRKGHVVKEEDIPVLLSIGKTHLFVWDLGENMVHENDAVTALYEACGMEGPFEATVAKEGGLHLTAGGDGLFLVDLALLAEFNEDGEMALVVRQSGVRVKKGDRVASFKVVPLAVERQKLDRVRALLAGKTVLAIKPYLPLKAAIIATGSEVYHGRIKDAFTPVVEQKLVDYGAAVIFKTVCDDKIDEIVLAVRQALDKGANLITCTGGMSVDPDDLTPGAIKASGAEIITYGAPVMPGAMFLVAYIGDVPVLGLPGCVMFGKTTILDVLLPRIATGRKITRKEVRHMGHGGLCLGCPTCVFPICGFGRGEPYGL